MLTVDNIHTYYGHSHILQGVSLTVAEGEAVALLGRNGVGKTTTIRSIIGFNPPRSGRVLLHDADVTGKPSYEIARQGVGLVPQGRDIFPTLTVRENMNLAARKAANGGWTTERVVDTFPFLAERMSDKGSKLSGGEQQMLAIGRALMTNPKLLLLDEPSEGLAPLIVKEIGRTISRLRDEGISILLVEQNLSLAQDIANRIYVMNKGLIVFQGTPGDLREQSDVMHQYLGV
jgi:branched-chain amino acid transport system ATP-binding protein